MAKQWLFPLVRAQGAKAVPVGLSVVLMLLQWRPWRRHLSRADAKAIALYGAALGGMNLMFYMSLRTLPFGLAVAIEFS
jgi:inner membrane transporter RhtA